MVLQVANSMEFTLSNSNWLECIKDAETDAPPLDIYTAASLGDTEVVGDALKSDPSLALRRNVQGWSPLMYAVWQGHETVVELLVRAARSAGQDAIQPAAGRLPRSGRTLLMIAARFDHLPIVQILCNMQAWSHSICVQRNTVETRDFRGQTALLHAIRGASESVVRFLIGQGANVNTMDNKGHTALWLAEHCHLAPLKRLLSAAGAVQDVPRFPMERQLVGVYQNQLALLLQGLSLEKYLPLFEKYSIDFDTFLLLTEDDLKNIGITLFGPRRKLALEISHLREVYNLTDDGQRKF